MISLSGAAGDDADAGRDLAGGDCGDAIADGDTAGPGNATLAAAAAAPDGEPSAAALALADTFNKCVTFTTSPSLTAFKNCFCNAYCYHASCIIFSDTYSPTTTK